MPSGPIARSDLYLDVSADRMAAEERSRRVTAAHAWLSNPTPRNYWHWDPHDIRAAWISFEVSGSEAEGGVLHFAHRCGLGAPTARWVLPR